MDAYLAISQRIGESLAAQVYGAPPCDAHLPDIVDRLYTAIYATQGKRVARKALGRIVTKVVRMTRGRGAGPEHDDSQDDL